jgi:cyclomaltodextrinase / maltogenic alpha-amylase / neopullulanase
MGWVEHAIWWHVYPLGFTGAPIREAGEPAPRLRRLLGWLDYAVELGASGLLLGPVFASRTHGYDTLDHFAIDPRLGSEADFDELVAACRARGLRIVLDGVFSHVDATHPTLAHLFARHADGTPQVFEGHTDLARLDHFTPQVVSVVADVLRHWLGRGIDGWRLDAAYSIPPAFWAEVLPQVRTRFPDAWFLGEVIHGDYAGIVKSSGTDTVTQYELWKAIWSSLSDGNLFELDWALSRHSGFLESFVPQTFVGNHDVTRIASTVGSAGALVALAVLMTVGGIPSIYAGDEQGFTGIKEARLGGDDAVRPAFPDTPADLAPWGGSIHRAHQDLVGLRRRHPWLTTAFTAPVALSNRSYTYRAVARDHSTHLEITLDLEVSPTATIRDASGTVLWRPPTSGA